MFSINAAFQWLIMLAGVGFIVLGVGALLMRCWTRPIERLRCIQVTFAAFIVTCFVQQFQILPQISLGWWPNNASSRIAMAPPNTGISETASRIAEENPAGHEPHEVVGLVAVPVDDARLTSVTGQSPQLDTQVRSSGESPIEPKLTMLDWFGVTSLIVFGLGAAWSIFHFVVGIVWLRRLQRHCVPAQPVVQAILDDLRGSRTVSVLVSSEVEVPLTFGIWRPAIVLPASMNDAADASALRHCLAHEWSHIANYDLAQWGLLQVLQPLLWYQPMYWLMRRELRISQDQVADHFATGSSSDGVSYAQLLVEFAKANYRRQMGLALTMQDGQSSLFRRVQLLFSDQRRLAGVCRSWTVGIAAAILVAVTVTLGVVNFGHAETPPAASSKDEKHSPEVSQPSTTVDSIVKKAASKAEMPAEKQPASEQSSAPAANTDTESDPRVMGEELPGGSLQYSGRVFDKSNKEPVKDAVVTVRRMIISSWDRRIIEESKHTTDDRGRYSFVIPPEQLAESRLYIELDVEQADYATKAGFGYALGMIRKNAKLNDPPFFSKIELDRADSITGRVVDSNGKPLVDVPILAYSRVNTRDFSGDNYGSFFRTKSAEDGTYRLRLTKGGASVFWVVPESYAPRQIVSGTKRGDWVDLQMEPGIEVSGQVLDATGKPVPNVWVNLTDKDSQSEIQMPVASALRRSAQSDADGQFKLRPLKPGKHTLEVEGYPEEICYHSRVQKLKEIPAVFPRRTVTIAENANEPLIIRAIPHVQFEAQYVDAKGQPKKGGWDIMVNGKLDGEYYFASLRTNADGRIQGMLPHGMEQTQLQLMCNEHGSLRIRLGKDKPLQHGREISLGTVEADIADVEIVRYTAPIVKLKVVDEAGKDISEAKIAGVYEADNKEKLRLPVGELPTSIYFEKQPGGIRRTSQMLPDEKTKFMASAEGYESAEETLSLAEGETKDLTLVLKRAPTASDTAPESSPKKSVETQN